MNTLTQDKTIVTTLAQIDSVLIFIAILTPVIALEHMAFRTAGWQERELHRRAVGTLTVLALALIPVVDGDADFWTWLMILAGFCIAGGVKLISTFLDRYQRMKLTGVLHERATATNETPVAR